MKPTLKAPGAKRLKLKHDGPLSNFAFKFNLRRYITVARFAVDSVGTSRGCCHVIQRMSNPRFLSQMASRGGQGGSLVPPYTRGIDPLSS
jgi:hypothetical protein